MRLSISAVAVSFVLAACGSQNPAPDTARAPTQPETRPDNVPLAAAPDAAPPPDDCANACTEIAVCWEEVNEGREYNQGGMCTSSCEEAAPDQKKAFFECVAEGRADCAAMAACGT